MTRPDASIVHGHSTALVNGDKARELVEAAGIVLAASWIGYEVPLADVSRLRAVALARNWRLVEHEPVNAQRRPRW